VFKKFYFERFKSEIKMQYRHLKRMADRWPTQVLERKKFGLRKKEKCGA